MAEIDSSGGGKKGGGKVRSKKVSTKIDMTPMVDLGFLLITFFMLTTTLQKPTTMQLNMPDDTKTEETQQTPLTKTLTIVPGPGKKCYYFQGLPDKMPASDVKITDYSVKGLRAVLTDFRTRIGDSFTVIMKPMDDAEYKNVVDLLDELAITNSTRYAIVEITPADKEIIKKSGL